VRHMVAVNDVVVPVTLAGLEGGALEAEGAFPGAGFGGSLVFGEGELASIAIPGAEEVDGLDAGGGAHLERELDSGHCGGGLSGGVVE